MDDFPWKIMEKRLEEQKIAGSLVLDQRKTMLEMVGEEKFLQALSSLPAERRQEFDSLIPVSWCPISLIHQVVDSVAKGIGQDPAEFQSEVARQGISRTLMGLWRTLLHLTTDEFLVKRASLLFSKSYERGKLMAHVPEPGHAVIQLYDWPDIADRDIRSISAGIGAVLTVAGRKNVLMKAQRKDDLIEYTALWRTR